MKNEFLYRDSQIGKNCMYMQTYWDTDIIYSFYVYFKKIVKMKGERFLHCVQKKTPAYVFDYNPTFLWIDFYTFYTNRNLNKYSYNIHII